MRKNSKAFTLIELMISISILALIMLFLYKSVAQLQKSNRFYAQKIEKVEKKEKVKKLFFLDLSLLMHLSYRVEEVEKDEDRLFFQTQNSIHHRYNPYVAYLVTQQHLYRVESSSPLSYPLSNGLDIDVDDLGKVTSFRVYNNKKLYKLLYAELDGSEYLMKIHSLNN